MLKWIIKGGSKMKDICLERSIITFLGPVGVGKSTQIKLTEEYLKSENKKVIKTFIKCSHVFAYILQKTLLLLGVSETVEYPNGVTKISPRREVLRKLFPLYCFLDMLSIAIKFLFRVNLPFSLGFTVLIEEGPLMTLHTYLDVFPRIYNFKPKGIPYVPQLLWWIMKKNHLNVVLSAMDEELHERRSQRAYRQYEFPEYIYSQKEWIKDKKCGNVIVVDTTTKTITEVNRYIRIAIEKHVGK